MFLRLVFRLVLVHRHANLNTKILAGLDTSFVGFLLREVTPKALALVAGMEPSPAMAADPVPHLPLIAVTASIVASTTEPESLDLHLMNSQ